LTLTDPGGLTTLTDPGGLTTLTDPGGLMTLTDPGGLTTRAGYATLRGALCLTRGTLCITRGAFCITRGSGRPRGATRMRWADMSSASVSMALATSGLAVPEPAVVMKPKTAVAANRAIGRATMARSPCHIRPADMCALYPEARARFICPTLGRLKKPEDHEARARL
jgi:hypothetical protein